MKINLTSGIWFAVIAFAVGCSAGRKVRTVSAIPQTPQSVSPEIFLIERTGMDDAAKALSVAIDWRATGATDPQRQVDLIQEAIRLRRYGIVITPAGGSAVDTTLQDAVGKDIPVVITQDRTSLREQPHLSFLLEDYEADARLVTERLRKLSLRRGTVIILGVDNYSQNSLHRLDALESALRRDCPGLKVARPIVAPFGSGYIQIEAQRSLERYRDVVAFITLNSRAGLGAQVATQERGENHRIAIITFDPAFAMLLGVRQRTVDSIVAQDMRGMGRAAIENIVADREGRVYTKTRTFSPLLVTPDNIDAPATQDWLQFNPEPHP